MSNTTRMREAWAPACQIQRATFRFWNGTTVNVDKRTLAALEALDACMEAHRYPARAGQTFAYNCRPITGGSGYSLHAYGIAVDINSSANPYGPKLVTDMPMGMVNAIKAIRTRDGKQVWGWGGDYSGNKDAMHFEARVTPAELAVGINPSTVPGRRPIPPKPLPEPEDDVSKLYILQATGQNEQYYSVDFINKRRIFQPATTEALLRAGAVVVPRIDPGDLAAIPDA